MLTTIGDKILEIRPKQIIVSDTELISDYLILLQDPTNVKRNKKNAKPQKQPPRNTQASS